MLHVRDASDEQINAGSDVERGREPGFRPRQPGVRAGLGRGAQPGDALAVEILEFTPRDWGWTAIIPGFGLLADEFPDPWLRISKVDAASGRVQFGEGITLPFRPFPGTIGVAPREPGEHSIVPPSDWGGNIDIKHLRAGTTLYLPVGVEGALFSVGDTHAAMGDGEVCGTAVETAMDITVRLTVRKDMPIAAPQYADPAGQLAATETSRLPRLHRESAPDLMEASKRGHRGRSIDHIASGYGLDRQEAYADRLGRLRPAHPRARRRAQLGGRRVPARERSSSRRELMAAERNTGCPRTSRPRPAPRAALLGGDRALDRDHGADGGDGAERRPRRARAHRAGRAAGVHLRHDRRAARLVRVRPAVAVLQPRRLGVRVRGRHAGTAGRVLRRLGAAGHLPGLHVRVAPPRSACSASPSSRSGLGTVGRLRGSGSRWSPRR